MPVLTQCKLLKSLEIEKQRGKKNRIMIHQEIKETKKQVVKNTQIPTECIRGKPQVFENKKRKSYNNVSHENSNTPRHVGYHHEHN
jgi:hypothetical protein